MRNFIFLLLVLILINSCKNNTPTETSVTTVNKSDYQIINDLQWLLGSWINQTDEKFSRETWSKENDSTFSGFSYTLVDNDTVFAETMKLQQKEENLFFTAAVPNQNDELPVTFKMIPSEKGQFVFENKNHDFPERIFYTNPTKDSIHAWIEGTINGEKKVVDFPFSREK